jgi:hypothetical protein
MHGFENVGYLVMEQGNHTLPGGERVEAGQFIQGGKRLSDIGFAEPFPTAPVLLASVTSANDAKAVTTRVRNVTGEGFQLQLEEQESLTAGHDAETIHYIAWQPSEGTVEGLRFGAGLTGNDVRHRVFPLSFEGEWDEIPVLLSQMQTTNGGDTATLRYQNLTTQGVDIWVEEEQSKDRETNHVGEGIGWIIFGEGG